MIVCLVLPGQVGMAGSKIVPTPAMLASSREGFRESLATQYTDTDRHIHNIPSSWNGGSSVTGVHVFKSVDVLNLHRRRAGAFGTRHQISLITYTAVDADDNTKFCVCVRACSCAIYLICCPYGLPLISSE